MSRYRYFNAELIELNRLLLEISDTYEKAYTMLTDINLREKSEELTRAIAALEVSQAAYDHTMTVIGEFEELQNHTSDFTRR